MRSLARCCLLAALLSGGCASTVSREGDVYRDTQRGYSIAVPGDGWSRTTVEGAALAFRGPDGAAMSMMSDCDGPLAAPAVLARHLQIGLRERRLRQAGPMLLEGQPGWTQTFDARYAGVVVRVKTITLVTTSCVLDWVLVASGAFEAVERSFDAWWSSYRAGEAGAS